MSKKLGYHITDNLKNEYDDFIIDKFGHKRNRCGSEIEKAMKLYMAMKGNEQYQNDPDVQAILKKAKKTYEKQSKTNILSQSKTSESLDERFEQIDEKLNELAKEIKNQTRRESSKKHGHADFKKQFQMAFQDHQQISRKDLEKFIINHSDIVDKRSVRGRIHYLESHGLLEIFAPNVYTLTVD